MAEQRQPTFMTGVALLLPITLSVMAIVLLAPVLPQMLRAFSSQPGYEFWVPMILTIPALCVAILSPVAGIAGDLLGRRTLLLWSFLAYAVLGVMPALLDNLWLILLSRVGVGVTEALIMVLSTTLIGDYFVGPTRDRWLAGQTAFASLSALLFFNLGGLLGRSGWQTPFWVYSSALVMLLLVLRWTWEPEAPREGRPTVPTGFDDEADADAGAGADWAGFPWRGTLMICAITVYGSIFFYTVQIQAPLGLAILGWHDPAQSGFWTSVASIGVPLGTFVYARLGGWPVKRLLAIEFAMLAIGFSVMGTARGAPHFLLGCFMNQLGAGMLLPTLLVWAMSLFPYAIRGRGAGMWTGAFSIGQFLSPIVVTLLGKAAGGLLPAFTALAAGAATGVAIALLGDFRRGDAAADGARSAHV